MHGFKSLIGQSFCQSWDLCIFGKLQSEQGALSDRKENRNFREESWSDFFGETLLLAACPVEGKLGWDMRKSLGIPGIPGIPQTKTRVAKGFQPLEAYKAFKIAGKKYRIIIRFYCLIVT